MNLVALGAIVVGASMVVAGVLWYGPWSLPALLVGLVVACGGLLWLCAVAIDQGIKEYIDYAKEGKERGSSRRA